jgi:hypothetical protein
VEGAAPHQLCLGKNGLLLSETGLSQERCVFQSPNSNAFATVITTLYITVVITFPALLTVG